MARAQGDTNQGYFVVASSYNNPKSGHVAVVVPGKEFYSTSINPMFP